MQNKVCFLKGLLQVVQGFAIKALVAYGVLVLFNWTAALVGTPSIPKL